MIYAEFGIGNASFFSTEIEENDEEYRIEGWRVEKVISLYVRIWINKKVIIIDSKEGIKFGNKMRKSFKILIGIKSK